MFEKIVNSKIYLIIDKIIRTIWVNILMLATTVVGLFFFSFGASIMAGTYVIKLIYQKYEGPVLPVYFKAFKEFYKKSTVISLIYLIIMLVLAFNVSFFIKQNEGEFSWMIFFSFMISLIGLVVSFLAMTHTLLISTCFQESDLGVVFKSGLKLTLAFISRGLLFVFASIILIYLTWLIPIIAFLLSFYLYALMIEFIMFRQYDKVPMFFNVSNEIAEQLII